MKKMLVGFAAFAALFTAVASAAEKTLDFNLVVKSVDPRRDDAPNVEGQSLTQSKAFGVVLFKDGRIGTKDYVYVSDMNNKGAGSGFGYSTYYFDEGSVTARFTFSIGAQGLRGEYKILSGTGAYAGATGTGSMESAQSTLKNASLLKIRLNVTTP